MSPLAALGDSTVSVLDSAAIFLFSIFPRYAFEMC